MLRGIFLVPLVIFRAIHSFPCHKVGILTSHSLIRIGAVEFNQHPMVCRHLCNRLEPIDHLGIVAVHKIDFETFHTPVRNHLENSLHLLVEVNPFHPKQYAHTLLCCIGTYCRHIHLRIQAGCTVVF